MEAALRELLDGLFRRERENRDLIELLDMLDNHLKFQDLSDDVLLFIASNLIELFEGIRNNVDVMENLLYNTYQALAKVDGCRDVDYEVLASRVHSVPDVLVPDILDVLGLSKKEKFRDLLESFLTHKDVMVRESAREALDELGVPRRN